jgi:hypothetical protein
MLDGYQAEHAAAKAKLGEVDWVCLWQTIENVNFSHS